MKFFRKIACTFLTLVAISQSSFSEFISPHDADQEALKLGLKMPEPLEGGGIPTLNKTCGTARRIDFLSKQFIDMAVVPGAQVLEVGAGYGLVCKDALKKGAQDYTVNDLDPRHLFILANTTQQELGTQYFPHLKLFPGAFPTAFDSVNNESYDAILAARIMHFLSPDQFNNALLTMNRLLKPKGKVFAIVSTPYIDLYPSFVPVFEKRVSEGQANPGYITNLYEFVDKKSIPAEMLEHMKGMSVFFVDAKTARQLFEHAGFDVEMTNEDGLLYIAAQKKGH